MKEPEFYRKKLDNGLIVIFEKRNIPVVSVSTSVKFGAQYEPENVKGISHFIEHLVFKGTKNRTVSEIPKQIESKGGIINAFTGEEITCFWNKLPSKYFSLGADVSRDLALNPLFENDALERERKVVLEEIKMYHDNPSTYILEKIKELLYKKPFNLSITGTEKTLSNLTQEKVKELFNSIYSTNNLIFAVVGKISWDEVLTEANKFPPLHRTIQNIKITENHGEIIEKRKGIDQAHLVLGYHMPKLLDKNRYAALVFDLILGNGMSSRLFQEIREKKGLCYAIKSHVEQSKDYSYGFVYSGTTSDKVLEVKNLILREIKKLKDLKLSDFNEAKETLIGLREISKEKCDSTMMDLLQEEIAGNSSKYYEFENEINKVRLEDVRNLSNLKGFSLAGLLPER
jgi:predicted Zn-dependent peptidase